MRLVDPSSLGQGCRYADARMFHILYRLAHDGPAGRRDIAGSIQVGEATTRRMLGILRKWGAVCVTHAGVSITSEGRDLISSIAIRLFDPEPSEYVIGRFQYGAVVSGVADRITDGIAQRNTAIIAGARGASVFTMVDGRLMMPPQWNMDEHDPVFSKMIRSVGLEDGDAVVITGAKDDITARMTAISTALDLF